MQLTLKKRLAILAALSALVPSLSFAGSGFFESSGGSGGGGGGSYTDDTQIRFGNSNDVACEYDTGQTNDAFLCGLSADSNLWIIGEKADMGTDFNAGTRTNPTIRIQSADATSPSKYIELSHNQTDALIRTGSGMVSMPDGIKTTGMTSFGSSAAVGNIPGVGYVLHSISDDLGSQIVPGVSQFPHEYKVVITPPSDLTGANATYVYANNFDVLQSVGNNNPYGIHYVEAATLVYTIGGNNASAHNGTAIGWSVNVSKTGASQLDSLIGAYVDSTSSASNPPALNIGWYLVTGNQTAATTLPDDQTLLISTPYHDGTLTTHTGIKIQDQEFGTTSYAIKSEGGKVEFGSPSGKDQYLLLTDGDVFEPFTSLGFDTKTFADIGPISSTAGGAKIQGISDTDSRPLEIDAYYGSTDPTDANEAIRLVAGKANGAGGVAALGASESIFRLLNNTTKLVNVLGSGNVSIGANDPNYSLDVNRPIGSDATFGLMDGDVTQPITSLHPTNTFFEAKPFNSTGGGALLAGISDGDTPGFVINGQLGTNSPSSSTAAFRVVGAKSNGTTGVSDLGNSDLLFEFVNNSLTSFPALMCTGGRLCGMSTQTPQARLDISSNGGDSSTQSFQVTNSGTGNPIFRVRNDSHVTVGPTAAGQTAFLNVTAPNTAGSSADAIDINSTLAAFNGSDNYTGLKINITNANHTGTGNTLYGIDIPGITFDADETATAIRVGSGGWNYGLELPTNIGIKLGSANIVYGGSDVSIDAPLNLSSSLIIGSGDAITKHISLSQANVTSASISASACGDYATISVTGAAVGDSVTATPDGDSSASGIEDSNLSWNAYVSATNTVTIRACNPTASPIDNGNDQTWRVDVWKH